MKYYLGLFVFVTSMLASCADGNGKSSDNSGDGSSEDCCSETDCCSEAMDCCDEAEYDDLATFNLRGNVHYVIRNNDTILEFSNGKTLLRHHSYYLKDCKVKRDGQHRLTDIDDNVIITGFEYEDGRVVVIKNGVDGSYECCDASVDTLTYTSANEVATRRSAGGNEDCTWKSVEKYMGVQHDSHGNWIRRQRISNTTASFFNEKTSAIDSVVTSCDTIIESRKIVYY